MNHLDNKFSHLKEIDEFTFRQIYIEYYELLCRYLLNFSSDRKKIEDVVQDTFLTLWTKRKELNITTSLKNYLFRASHNNLMSSYRKAKKKNLMLHSYLHTALIQAINLNDTMKEKQLDKLDDCIKSLPKRCQNIFIENKLKGKKYKEVATQLNISIKTVEGHITKAYKLIKSCMQDVL